MDNWSSPGKPPDPFALPSETDAHFTLLIVSVVGSSILLYAMLFNYIPAFWDAKQAEIARCSAEVAAAIPGTDILQQSQRIELQAACERPIRIAQSAWQLGGCLLLSTLAVGLYWWLPKRTLRRSGFRALDHTQDPDLLAAVDGLARDIGLKDSPKLVCNPLHGSGGGVAFGRWGERFLGLYGGTLLRFRRHPDVFRGVVLHELAHVRNADIDKATLAVTVWWAFLLAAVVPTAVGILLTGLTQPDRVLALAWRLVVVAGLVALTRAAVLRERELFADQRAWLVGAPGLVLALEHLREPSVLARLRLPKLVRRAVALHPSPAERLADLSEPAALFLMTPWTAFAAGMATTLALESVGSITFGFLSGLSNDSAAALLLAVPLAAVLALSMWRDETYRRQVGPAASTRSTVVLGLALAAGLFAGWHTSIDFFAYEASPFRLTGLQSVLFELGFVGLCSASMVVFVAWLRAGSRAWLLWVGDGRRSVRLGLTGATAAATVLLAAVLASLSYGIIPNTVALNALDRSMLDPLVAMGWPTDLTPEQTLVVFGFGASLLQLMSVPQVPLILALLWAYPLAAGLLPGAHAQRPRWRLVGVVSVLMGVAIVPAFFVFGFAFLGTISVLTLALSAPLVFGLFQFGAGLLVRFRVRDFGVLHALAASQLTGLVASVLLLGFGDMSLFATAGFLVAAVSLLLLEPLILLMRRERRPNLPAAAGAVSGGG